MLKNMSRQALNGIISVEMRRCDSAAAFFFVKNDRNLPLETSLPLC